MVVDKLATVEQLLEYKFNNDDFCQVKGCYKKRNSEPVEVWLQKKTGDKFLVSIFLCDLHRNTFEKSPVTFISYVKQRQIRGVDPSLINFEV